ncbi:MAG: T9SS type A sorting domain-containing protein, partial [Gelidibacter sp.]|nr:T9SS type A sorting domain-containing protein [Gelidibacter sp.]
MKKTLLSLITISIIYGVSFSQTTFSTKKTIDPTTNNTPYVIDSGLIDNDAFKDIVIGTESGNEIQWYKNNGDGTFTEQTLTSSTLSYVYALKIGDVNGDNFNDVVVTTYSGGKVVWFQNDGLGNFSSEKLIANMNSPVGVAIADLDNNTTKDVIALAYNTGQTIWFSNDGAGNFAAAQVLATATASYPGSIDVADFDNDNDLDFVIANAGAAGNVEVYYNNLIPNGTTTFTKDANSVTTGNYYLFNTIFADVDNDNHLDILATDAADGTTQGYLYWYKKELDGTFTETNIPTSINNPSTVGFADLDDDGLKDIILGNSQGEALEPNNTDLAWFKNNGSGNFSSEMIIDITQSQTFAFTIADFDNDNDLDISSVSYNQDALNWFENFKYTLSTPKVSLQDISIYPNPTKNFLNFKGLTQSIKVSIYDLIGKEVLKETLNPEKPFDVSSLQSGVYLLKLDGYTTNFRFI